MEIKLLLLSLVTLSVLSLASAVPSTSILSAAEVLSNSGTSVAMALTLELVADTVASLSPTITIFAPSDAAFVSSGQPSLSLLQLHLSPLSLSPSTLRSLTYGAKIPTMSSGKSLTVTSLPISLISLNNVTVASSPLYDDGTLIIYEIPHFFDPNFTATTTISASPPPHLSPRCPLSKPSPFLAASKILKSRGYSIAASFLDLQLDSANVNLTVFAPIDDVITHSMGNFSDYSGMMLRHVTPCGVKYAELEGLGEGTVLGTYSEEFGIRVSKSNGLVLVNEIPITFPDMFVSNWLVVHGLHEVLEPVAEEVGPRVEPGPGPRGSEF